MCRGDAYSVLHTYHVLMTRLLYAEDLPILCYVLRMTFNF